MSHNIEDYKAAAKKLPMNRTTGEQALVDEAYSLNMVEVKNVDHAAQNAQRYGTSG